MAERDYSVSIKNCSKALNAKERIMMKDVSDAFKLDTETQAGDVLIDVDFYVQLAVHNAKSENSDYDVYVVVDKNGSKYVTGSESFFHSFADIMDEVADAGDEMGDWQLCVYRKPSKNRPGKDFITCSIR